MNAPDVLDSEENEFAQALQQRVGEESTDLDILLAGALRQGGRRRLRRRAGVALAAAACVGAAATAYVVLPGDGDGGSQQVATATDDRTTIEQRGDLSLLFQDGELIGVVGRNGQARFESLLGTDSLPEGKAFAFERDPQRMGELRKLFPEIDDWRSAFAVTVVDEESAQPESLRDTSPVSLDLSGWTCEWFPVDDKGACSGPAGAVAGVVWRPAAERSAFLAKQGPVPGAPRPPMLGGEGIVTEDSTIVGPVRNGIFVTVQPGHGTTPEIMAAIASGLGWTE